MAKPNKPVTQVCNTSEKGANCAVGAAISALSQRPQLGYVELRRVFPQLRQSLVEAIVQRNDWLGWTREQIADWIVASGLGCEAMLNSPPDAQAGELPLQLSAEQPG